MSKIWVEFPPIFLDFLLWNLISGKTCLGKNLSFDKEEIPIGLTGLLLRWVEMKKETTNPLVRNGPTDMREKKNG